MMQKKQRAGKYSGLSNQWYLHRELWGYDKTKYFFWLLEIILTVSVTYLGVWTPAFIIRCLEQKLPFGTIVLQIAVVFTGYGMISAVKRYIKRHNSWQLFDFINFHMTPKMQRKMLTMDYCLAENEETQKLNAKAKKCFSGRGYGIEAILFGDVTLIIVIINLIIFSIRLSGVSPLIIVLLFVVSLLQLWGFRLADKKKADYKAEWSEIHVGSDYLKRQAYDRVAGKDIRLYQLGGWLNKKFHRLNKRLHKLQKKEETVNFSNDLAGMLLQLIRDIICYGYLLKSLIEGMAASDFVLYIGMITGFAELFSEITEKCGEMISYLRHVGYLREYLELPQVLTHENGMELDRDTKGLTIEFSHVSFSYPGTEKKILDDISFSVRSGEKLALVGVNGAGKSTIVKLLCGFYPVEEGCITINGIDIKELNIDTYYDDLAVVFQEMFSYSFSIAANIACTEDGTEDTKRLSTAIEQAGIRSKLERLPKKEYTYLNKELDDEGISLSGGEMQKLMLARALYKNARLILLDEPTAAMDALAEHELYEKYKELTREKTTMFISHRLASTRFCDKILFLENGKITERGTHEELLKKKGAYAAMFEVQRKYYMEQEESHEENLERTI